MCGIFASVVIGSLGLYPSHKVHHRLRNRGPDRTFTTHRKLRAKDDRPVWTSLTISSSVLALRGNGITAQPLMNSQTGAILCWNGEAWSISGQPVTGNDATAIFSLLQAADDVDAVLDVFRSIQGPFAFIYWNGRKDGQLFFGRDRLGRRSLLAQDGKEAFLLSSVADSTESSWKEIEADGVYVMNLVDLVDPALGTLGLSSISKHDWMPKGQENYVSNIGIFNLAIPSAYIPLEPTSQSVQALRTHLVASLSRRVQNVPCPPLSGDPGNARIAVLFSGGLDCTVLARVASELVPSNQEIDLINVAFENPRVVSAAAATIGQGPVRTDAFESCPDRITGRNSFRALQNACPSRHWRFVAVDVPYTETLAQREEIVELMHPHNTEMDLSIASALYFAARGEGWSKARPETDPIFYTSTARVLLSGLGADELFGGYGRHSVAFGKGSFEKLIAEMKLDASRISKRNLGRDDRVMSHWGREVRFPYLDENLFKWAIECPVWEKCDFASPKTEFGIGGDKKILRLLAEELGMTGAAREKKRAIQFGARTAKMESGKTIGTAVIGQCLVPGSKRI